MASLHHPLSVGVRPPPLDGLPPLPPLYVCPESARGRRWLRGHHSPPPLCAALLALRRDGTVTLVGEGGRWMEGFRRGRILVVVIGWLDGSWMDWMGLGRRGKGQCPKNPPPDQFCLLFARGDCCCSAARLGSLVRQVRCPCALVDFDLFRGATMAPRVGYSVSAAIVVPRRWAAGDDEAVKRSS